MERLTEHHVNKTLGAYIVCSMACIDDDLDCNNCEKFADMVDYLAAYEDTMPLERAQELAQAEKDGRLVVLPVPVGENKVVYSITDSYYGPQQIVTLRCESLEKLEIWNNHGHKVVVEVDGWEIEESDIGKTVFLTREEAKAALKKREEEYGTVI